MSLAKRCHQPILVVVCGLILFATGCRQPSQAQHPLPVDVDVWEVMYIGDAKVGFGHTHTKVSSDKIETTSENQLTFDRFGQTITLEFALQSIEKPDGTPLSFSATQKVGPSQQTASGVWQGDNLTLEAGTVGKKETKTIAWKPEYGSVFAKEQSLQRAPLKAEESRTLTVFFPMMNRLGQLRLIAGEKEWTKLLEGESELLKISCIEVIGEQRVNSTLWTNERGEILKQYVPQLKQTSYRTTKEIATGKSAGPKFDLGDSTIVKIAKPIARPHQTSEITYKASLPDGDIAEVFVAGPTQTIKAIDKHTAEVTVHAIRPTEPAKLAEKDTSPTDDDLAPNSLIQSDDARIVQMAKSVAPNETDPWKIAVALESFVRGTIKQKNFSQAFASAAEVAQSKEGDCTEHAVLLAALCRARKIPARGAMGLVYYPQGNGFAYHMWTEVWIHDRWVPLDATLAKGGIGAAHLKLAHANLKGADAYSAFLPVFKVLGQLKLEVVAAK